MEKISKVYDIQFPLLGVGTTIIQGSLPSLGIIGVNAIQVKAYGNIIYVLESSLSNVVEVII
jgi:hypothetical protein